MLRYLLFRLAIAIPTIFAVSAVVFLMLYLTPGDPATIYIGDRQATPERIAQIREVMGLNRPLIVQYLDFFVGAFRGDAARSLQTNQLVSEQIAERLPSTIELTVAAFLVSVVFGTSLGVLSAVKHNRWIDTVSRLLALAGVSMPVFWLGLLGIYLFSVQLRWFPVTGQGGLDRLVLPAFTLGIVTSAPLMRLVRSAMLEVLKLDYVRTARAKGQIERIVIVNHALRNALLPIVTVLGLQLGGLLSGAVITESVFARAGLGKLIVDSILSKDFPVVQGVTLYIAVLYVLINVLVDLSYGVLDPRIRLGARR
ncbi:MAG: ABC transporter permease [Thermoflexales bacterium]